MFAVPKGKTTLEAVAQMGVFCQFHLSNGYVARGVISALHPDGWFEVSTSEQLVNGAQVVRIEARK